MKTEKQNKDALLQEVQDLRKLLFDTFDKIVNKEITPDEANEVIEYAEQMNKDFNDLIRQRKQVLKLIKKN